MNKRIKYPIFFYDYRICIHCGSHSVVPIDRFGRTSVNMIYPISYLQCKKCGTTYNIKWIKDENDKYIPTCCDIDSKRDVERNILLYAISQKRHI